MAHISDYSVGFTAEKWRLKLVNRQTLQIQHLHDWQACKVKLKAAPARAVSVITPADLVICRYSGLIRISRGTYWHIIIIIKTFLAFITSES